MMNEDLDEFFTSYIRKGRITLNTVRVVTVVILGLLLTCYFTTLMDKI